MHQDKEKQLTCVVIVARVLAVRATQSRRDAAIAPNETAGFKYIPGGREWLSYVGVNGSNQGRKERLLAVWGNTWGNTQTARRDLP